MTLIELDAALVPDISAFIVDFEKQIKTLMILLDTAKCRMHNRYKI